MRRRRHLATSPASAAWSRCGDCVCAPAHRFQKPLRAGGTTSAPEFTCSRPHPGDPGSPSHPIRGVDFILPRMSQTAPKKTTSGKRGVPERIGKYEIINEVGRGSTGIVYLSHDPYYKRD